MGNWCLTSLGYLQTLRSFSFNNIYSKSGLRTKLTLIKMISIFLLWIFHLYVAIFQQHLYMEYISVTSGARTAYLSGAAESNPVSTGIRVAQSIVFCLVFCRWLFVILSFLFCLSFALRLLQTFLTAMSVLSVLLVNEIEVCEENHRPVTNN